MTPPTKQVIRKEDDCRLCWDCIEYIEDKATRDAVRRRDAHWNKLIACRVRKLKDKIMDNSSVVEGNLLFTRANLFEIINEVFGVDKTR